ncbi:MAG: aryl-sulfate sulfotransferase [Proteobacteria bacterium]|nr:aryl-sulfate sulfotransferase [Pseudomonadota bacterium]MBU1687165.1 aryl-sulfate sulfotransferase [Pseudomonadota bacterium]
MKRTILIFGISALFLSGCGGGDGNSQQQPGTSTSSVQMTTTTVAATSTSQLATTTTASVATTTTIVVTTTTTIPAVQGRTTGLFINEPGAAEGYTLVAPMMATTTYLLDNNGNFTQTWESTYTPGLGAYLLADGNLLRAGNTHNTTFTAGGAGGIVEEIDQDGNVVWSYRLSDDQTCLHHDLEVLPGGNILMIAWEMKNQSEAIAAGRDPSRLGDGELWPDSIIEVDPSTSEIVWQWQVWDHLVQEEDATKANYGVVAQHPELIDLNSSDNPMGSADWTHFNSVAYVEADDRILISVHGFSEVWVIDHSTTTAEAAAHTGGASGKGGDLLYRWGNPETYGQGSSSDRKLYGQHDATWIPEGEPGAGNILLFNNGQGRPTGDYSSIEELTPPMNPDRSFSNGGGNGFGPDTIVWTYTAPNREEFFSRNISGVQRLTNGNTLICEGITGWIFELNSLEEVVWKYVNPVTANGILGATESIPMTPGGSQQNQVFKVRRYAPEYSGLSGFLP